MWLFRSIVCVLMAGATMSATIDSDTKQRLFDPYQSSILQTQEGTSSSTLSFSMASLSVGKIQPNEFDASSTTTTTTTKNPEDVNGIFLRGDIDRVPRHRRRRDQDSDSSGTTKESRYQECVSDSGDLYEANEDLQLDGDEDCTGLGTLSADCVYTFQKSDWDAHEAACTEAGGIAHRYEELVVDCNARSAQRQSGARLTDSITYVNVPYCFQTSTCEEFYEDDDNACSRYADLLSDSWEGAYRNAEADYYSIFCSATFKSCSTNYKSGLSTAALVGIIAGSVVIVGIIVCFFCCRKKKNNDDDDTDKDKDDTKKNDSTTTAGKDDDDIPTFGTSNAQRSVIPADAVPLKFAGTNGETDKQTTSMVVDDDKKKDGNDDDDDDDEGAPKQSYGALQGWVRDKHFKHTILWLGNIIFLGFWIQRASIGCEPARYGDGCDIDSKSWFWIELKWLVLFIWVMIYGFYMWEFIASSTRKYLKNVNTTESLLEYMKRLYRTEPTLSLYMECYHYETRIVTYTDSNGNTQTRTETYPVVTYTETEIVHIISWEDVSVPLRNKDVREYQVTKLVLTKSFAADANFDQQRSSLIARNRFRDVYYNLIVRYNIEGFHDRMLSYVDLSKKPPFLTSEWCWLFHITLVLALPYRLWMSSITGKTDANVHKRLQTSRFPKGTTPESTPAPTAPTPPSPPPPAPAPMPDPDKEEEQEEEHYIPPSNRMSRGTTLPGPPTLDGNDDEGVEVPLSRNARFGRQPSGGLDSSSSGFAPGSVRRSYTSDNNNKGQQRPSDASAASRRGSGGLGTLTQNKDKIVDVGNGVNYTVHQDGTEECDV